VAGRTQVVYYRDKAGKEPVNAFLDELAAVNPRAAAKIDDYVGEYPNDKDASAPPPEHPISSQVDGELRELRVRFAKTRYRVLYRRSGLLVVLLHIFEKDTEKLPARDRDLAVKRFEDFKTRMDAVPRRRPRPARRTRPSRVSRAAPTRLISSHCRRSRPCSTRNSLCASSAPSTARSNATSPPWPDPAP